MTVDELTEAELLVTDHPGLMYPAQYGDNGHSLLATYVVKLDLANVCVPNIRSVSEDKVVCNVVLHAAPTVTFGFTH